MGDQPIVTRVSGDPNGNNGLYYMYTDHLGSAHILTRHSNGYVVSGSPARYAPFGDWRTEPTTNPAISGRGYTGHRHNNTGANDLGLIYMRARFYVPSIGRFASADTIVPEPKRPQSFNRYAYTLNNPLRYIDPSGHIACEALPMECQIDSNGSENWTIGDYATEDWHETASTVAINTVADVIKETSLLDLASGDTEWPDWTYSRLFPDYFIVQGTGLIFSGAVIADDYSNIYASAGASFGAELMIYGLSARIAGGWVVAEQVPSTEGMGLEWALKSDSPTETDLEEHLSGLSVGGGVGAGPPQTAFIGPGLDGSLSVKSNLSLSVEAGIYTPQAGASGTLTGLIYDTGSAAPWFFQKWRLD